MGIMKGGLAVTRFYLDGDLSSLRNADSASAAIEQYRFRDIEGGAEMSLGWSLFESPFDGDHSLGFSEDTLVFDKYVAFCLRVDRKRVPGSVKKIEVDKAIRREAATTGVVSKERKGEIKEAVLLRLMTKATAVPSATEVVIDPDSRIAYVASGQAKAVEIFCELFSTSFPGITLTPLNAISAVQQRMTPDTTHPFGDLQSREDACNFVSETGAMFLTWLWFRDGREMGGNGVIPAFSLYLDRKLAAASEAGSMSVTANPAMPGGLDVALKAVAQGSRLYSARTIAAQDELFFDLALTNELAMSGIKLPKVEIESDSADIEELRLATLILRMDLLTRLCSFVDTAYGEFLDVAMERGAWEREAAQIIKWAQAQSV